MKKNKLEGILIKDNIETCELIKKVRILIFNYEQDEKLYNDSFWCALIKANISLLYEIVNKLEILEAFEQKENAIKEQLEQTIKFIDEDFKWR